mmetsp:Transcript_39319/g.95104  ORF Transcript_39319/g.95104 Transcript_39319/m.95104 type:complete len:325 (+) Transcript_39319:834-1808(+)
MQQRRVVREAFGPPCAPSVSSSHVSASMNPPAPKMSRIAQVMGGSTMISGLSTGPGQILHAGNTSRVGSAEGNNDGMFVVSGPIPLGVSLGTGEGICEKEGLCEGEGAAAGAGVPVAFFVGIGVGGRLGIIDGAEDSDGDDDGNSEGIEEADGNSEGMEDGVLVGSCSSVGVRLSDGIILGKIVLGTVDGLEESDGTEEGENDATADGLEDSDGMEEGEDDATADGLEDSDGMEEGEDDATADGLEDSDGPEVGEDDATSHPQFVSICIPNSCLILLHVASPNEPICPVSICFRCRYKWRQRKETEQSKTKQKREREKYARQKQ